MHWIYDDGGREAAGYKGSTRDCACRAISIATCRPYQHTYHSLNDAALTERPRRASGRRRSAARTGVSHATMRRYMAQQFPDWEWTPTMGIGTGCQVHLRDDELPSGRLIASLSGHYAAVIDGVLHDTHDCSRESTRCVYGYWHEP